MVGFSKDTLKRSAQGAAIGLAGKAIGAMFGKDTVAPAQQSVMADPKRSRTVVDYRARLKIKPGDFNALSPPTDIHNQPLTVSPLDDALGEYNKDSILEPLRGTAGILFPYTPTVQFGHTANYTEMTFVHSNYSQSAYNSSKPNTIMVTAMFTSQTSTEAAYTLAVLRFLNFATKSYFGRTPVDKVGAPPIVLMFSYLGEHMFNDVPVVIKTYNTTYENTVSYVPVHKNVEGEHKEATKISYVPAEITITMELEVQVNPNRVSSEFDLDKFKTGELLKGSYGGGFI